MNKILYVLSWIVIVGALTVMSIGIFWMLYPYKTTEFKDGLFPVENKLVKNGEYVVFDVYRCKISDLQPTIARSFVDGIVYIIPETAGTLADTGCDTTKVYVYVPKGLPPGKYHINTVYRWQVNPIRVIEQQKSTEQFEVIK
jgi:hypothetical protein